MDAGLLLREARGRAGLSQAALAKATGTSQATVSAYESGRKDPTVATLNRLLAVTGHGLAIEPQARVVQPSAAQHAQVARTLSEVISLAESLPVRHSETLNYPRLATK